MFEMEMLEGDEGGMKTCGTLDGSDETIATLGGTRSPQTAKQEGDEIL